MDKVNVAEKFRQIWEYWKPYIAAELNGQCVKLDKLKGEFVWHHHENEDEMLLVVKGRLRLEFRDKHVWLEEGEFMVVPRGVEHRPVAGEEAHVLLFEPASTLNHMSPLPEEDQARQRVRVPYGRRLLMELLLTTRLAARPVNIQPLLLAIHSVERACCYYYYQHDMLTRESEHS